MHSVLTYRPLDDFTMKEHNKFINQLYNLTKDRSVKSFNYDKYKENPMKYDKNLKKIISENYYDIILGISKNNSL